MKTKAGLVKNQQINRKEKNIPTEEVIRLLKGEVGSIPNFSTVYTLINKYKFLSSTFIDQMIQYEKLYHEMIENASDILFTIDLKGNFISVNKSAVRAVGYSTYEALKMNISQIVAPEYLALVQNMIAKKIKVGGQTRYEVVVITKKGKRLPLEVSTKIFYANKKPVVIQGIARDI